MFDKIMTAGILFIGVAASTYGFVLIDRVGHMTQQHQTFNLKQLD
jgi:hypothetical protein